MLQPQIQPLTAGCCCGKPQPTTPRPVRRGWEIAAGATSLAVWVFLPKCPLCLAAHAALWTGVGLSFTQAASIRTALLWVSVAVLGGLMAKFALLVAARLARPASSQPAGPGPSSVTITA